MALARAVLLGLTGGIGSGKSTVAQMLVARGAVLVDADVIARSLTEAGGLAIPALVSAFGSDCLNANGAMDREKMRLQAFNDPASKRLLEGIIHPMVQVETQRQTDVAVAQGAPCIVFDVPLLVESGIWRQKVHRILVVDCSPEVQIQRVIVRNQLSQPVIEKIIASQAQRSSRLGAADWVICNVDLTLKQLANEVDALVHFFGL